MLLPAVPLASAARRLTTTNALPCRQGGITNLQLRLAAGSAPARYRLIPLGVVVVGQLFAGQNVARRPNPNRLVDDVDPAVRLAGMIDEPGDVAFDIRVSAQDAAHAKHPDAPLAKIAIFAGFTLLVG